MTKNGIKLRNHLDYLHMHILSVVSMGQLQRMFAKRSNFDLRRLLEGTDTILSSLIARLQEDFALLTGSLEPARIKQSARDEIGKLLIPTLKNKVCSFQYMRTKLVDETRRNRIFCTLSCYLEAELLLYFGLGDIQFILLTCTYSSIPSMHHLPW